jgi:ectoine hydroxylase-related dioxygenase (phytanoyl-CoA dioxygenase family)
MALSEDKLAKLRKDGRCVVPDALTPGELERVRDIFDRALETHIAEAGTAFDGRLDHNASNLRLYDLPALDPVFIELLMREDALAAARAAVPTQEIAISNFTANVALPGSESMNLHSDQALVIPPPWNESWAVNVIWCLDDVDEENGATRYLPGSQHISSLEDLPENAMDRTISFEAKAGSFVVMEGRMWHTSGRNLSADRQRRLMFAYYTADFIRPQANWSEVLPQQVKDGMDDATRAMFGLGPAGNVRLGGALTRLAKD